MKTEHRKTTLACVYSGVAVVLALYSLRMVLHSGYYFDDSLNSLLRAYLLREGKSLWNHLYESVTAFRQGRMVPLSICTRFLVHYAFHTVTSYKIAIVAGVLTNIAVFGFFLRRITGSLNVATLSMLLIPIFFQIRNYHDPITSYNLLPQLLFLYLFLAVIFFYKFLDDKKPTALFVCILFYLAALLSYEISYLFLLLFFVLSYLRHKDFFTALKMVAPLCLLAVVTLAAGMFIKVYSPGHYAGVKANMDVAAIFAAFLKQLYGTLPMSYYFHTRGPVLSFITAADIGYALIFFLLLTYLLRKAGEERTDVTVLITLGLGLLILPAFTIALSVKYQNELAYGTAYLPVYLQYFGLLMFFVGSFLFILSRIYSPTARNGAIVLFSFVAATIGLLNIGHNKSTVEEMNRVWKYPREVLELSLKKGIADELPDGSVVFVEMRGPHNDWYLYPNTTFFYQNTGKSFIVLHIRNGAIFGGNIVNNHFLNRDELQALSGRNAYLISYSSDRKDVGTVLLSKVKNSFTLLNAAKNAYDLKDLKVEIKKVFTVNEKTVDTDPFGRR